MCVIHTFVNCIVMGRIKMGILEIHISEKGPFMRFCLGLQAQAGLGSNVAVTQVQGDESITFSGS